MIMFIFFILSKKKETRDQSISPNTKFIYLPYKTAQTRITPG